MSALGVIAFVVWVYLLTVFRRVKLDFWLFTVGCIGLFVFSLLALQPILTPLLIRLVAGLTGLVGSATGLYSSYMQYGMLFINNSICTVSLYIDYECSGVIEILAFAALLAFFDVYNPYEKLVVGLLGAMWIVFANVVRIFVICLLIYWKGNGMFYFAHTIFGRVVFYVLSIALYFTVFTRAHIVRQKVARFDYGLLH